jgi:hypothetical protein
MEKIFFINIKVIISFYYFRTPKELKNHFHTCIIKSVRKIINNKFDYELKDIMRYFYAFEYLVKLINDYEENEDCFKNYHLKKLITSRRKYKFNPKLLIKNKLLSNERILHYSSQLTKEILLNKPGIKNFLSFINYKETFGVNNVLWLFSIIVKSKMINNCKKILEKGEIKNIEYIKKVQKYLEENSSYIYFDDMFFNKN